MKDYLAIQPRMIKLSLLENTAVKAQFLPIAMPLIDE